MKLFALIIIFITFFSCKNSIKTSIDKKTIHYDGFTISGTHNSVDGNIFLLNNLFEKVDSTTINNHIFNLKGKIATPNLHYLQSNNSDYKLPFVIENTQYSALLNTNKGEIFGGNLNTKLSDYLKSKNNFNLQLYNIYEEYTYKDINLKSFLKSTHSIKTKENILFTDFIIRNSNNILSSIVLKQKRLSSKEAVKLKKLLIFSNNVSLLTDLDTITKRLKIEEAKKNILKRKTAPLFSGVNLMGSKTSLKTIMKNKKVFLIDFWASWCPPCREASPKLIQLYKQYKNKGFDILTVSEDRSVADWKNGVYGDEIENWHHVYDDFNRISSLYGVTSLPHLVLIDENGKIIKNKISLSNLKNELQKKINE